MYIPQPGSHPNGHGIESHDPAGGLAVLARAEGAVQGGGVEHVLVVRVHRVAVLQHHVRGQLLDGLGVGEAGGVRREADLALEGLPGVSLLDVPGGERLSKTS